MLFFRDWETHCNITTFALFKHTPGPAPSGVTGDLELGLGLEAGALDGLHQGGHHRQPVHHGLTLINFSA